MQVKKSLFFCFIKAKSLTLNTCYYMYHLIFQITGIWNCVVRINISIYVLKITVVAYSIIIFVWDIMIFITFRGIKIMYFGTEITVNYNLGICVQYYIFYLLLNLRLNYVFVILSLRLSLNRRFTSAASERHTNLTVNV